MIGEAGDYIDSSEYVRMQNFKRYFKIVLKIQRGKNKPNSIHGNDLDIK